MTKIRQKRHILREPSRNFYEDRRMLLPVPGRLHCGWGVCPVLGLSCLGGLEDCWSHSLPPPILAGLPKPTNGDGTQGAERPQVSGGVLPSEGDPPLSLHVPDRPVLPRGRVGLHREDWRPLCGLSRCFYLDLMA